MTVSAFLDLAFSVIVDERVNRGWKLDEALGDMKSYARGGDTSSTIIRSGAQSNTVETVEQTPFSNVGGPGAPVTAAEIANMEAMATFQALMSNTGGMK